MYALIFVLLSYVCSRHKFKWPAQVKPVTRLGRMSVTFHDSDMYAKHELTPNKDFKIMQVR